MSNPRFSYNKNKRKTSKKETVLRHVFKRFKERFGIFVTSDNINSIIKIIKSGQAVHYFKESNTRSFFIVEPDFMQNQKIVVVYNKEKKYIHTVFPIEYLSSTKFNENITRRQTNNACVSMNGTLYTK